MRYETYRVGNFVEVFDTEEKETVYVREGREDAELNCRDVADELNEKDIYGLNVPDPL